MGNAPKREGAKRSKPTPVATQAGSLLLGLREIGLQRSEDPSAERQVCRLMARVEPFVLGLEGREQEDGRFLPSKSQKRRSENAGEVV